MSVPISLMPPREESATRIPSSSSGNRLGPRPGVLGDRGGQLPGILRLASVLGNEDFRATSVRIRARSATGTAQSRAARPPG
jgi:hypothetical protein